MDPPVAAANVAYAGGRAVVARRWLACGDDEHARWRVVLRAAGILSIGRAREREHEGGQGNDAWKVCGMTSNEPCMRRATPQRAQGSACADQPGRTLRKCMLDVSPASRDTRCELRRHPRVAWTALLALGALLACGRRGPVPVTAPTPAAAPTPASRPPSPTPSEPAPAARVAAASPPVEAARTGPSAACLARSADAARTTLAVQRWVDRNGIVHYSDRAAPPDARELRTVTLAVPPQVTVQASGHDVNLPGQLQQRAVADALAVARVLHDTLGVAMPQGMVLHIVFVRSPVAYAQLIGVPELAASAGAYNTGTRTIHVRMQDDDEASFAVLRHEIVHAIVHEAIGNLPVAINEGLAEYFGRYRVVGMGGQIDLGRERAALLANAPGDDGGEALVDLLAPEEADFYRVGATGPAGREQRYRRAFALVAMLMGSGSGRATLAGLLAAQAARPCDAVASERWFAQHHRGGLATLAREWVAFMRNPPDGVRTY